MKIPSLTLALVLWAALPAAGQTSGRHEDITFKADRLHHDLAAGTVTLTGNVTVNYGELEIQAGRVVYDTENRRLHAEPAPDSTGALAGYPDFTRGEEHFVADRMEYDLAADRGRVWGGRAVSQGKYHIRGEHVLLDSLQNVHLRDISMSTCEYDHPHYRFLAGRLKVVESDKAIARNVTFQLGPAPLFWFPFYVFPLDQGRHSGILTPGLGTSSRDGLTVSNLGYYLAPNDYWDATLAATLRERGGMRLDGEFRYAVRRRMNGNIDVSFENFNTLSGTTTRSWRLNLSHYQRLSTSSNVRASGSFTNSRTFDERNSDNVYDYLNRQLRSSLSVDKQWRESGRSVDGSLTFIRDLETSRNDYRGFPRLAFRQGRRRIFGGDHASSGYASPSAQRPWYQAFYYSLSADLDNAFITDPADSLESEDVNFGGRLALNSQHRPFGWLELTPSFTASQRLSRNNQERPTRTETYAGRVSTGTTLYGFFYPQVGRLRGIRHRFQPRVDFSYDQRAAVSGGTFGFGGEREAEDARRSAVFNLSNTFDVKTEGEEGRPNRFTVLTATSSTGIDFDALGPRRIRPLRTTISVRPDQRFDLRLNMSHDLYTETGEYKPLQPRLTDFTVTTSVRLRGSRQVDTSLDTQNDLNRFNPVSDFGVERSLYTDYSTRDPWRMSLTHYYAARTSLTTTTRTSWVKFDLGFTPFPGLRLDYSINVDIVNPDIEAQNISIYKDLHCFESRLSIYPNGFNRGFSFRINIRDIPQFGYTHRKGRV